jgi:RNA polymerase sigma-70 factor (ECF subfamily)
MAVVVALLALLVPGAARLHGMDELTRLARAASRGDEAALIGFVRRGQPEVWRLCAHLVDRESADDLTQEVFVRAIPALARFRGDASARTWLLSIARRTCADAIRGSQRRRGLLRRAGDEAVTTGTVVAAPDEDLALVDLVARLELDRRAAFVLTQMLGLGYAEAAEVCGVPVGTIRSRIARARADLVGMAAADDDVAGQNLTT